MLCLHKKESDLEILKMTKRPPKGSHQIYVLIHSFLQDDVLITKIVLRKEHESKGGGGEVAQVKKILFGSVFFILLCIPFCLGVKGAVLYIHLTSSGQFVILASLLFYKLFDKDHRKQLAMAYKETLQCLSFSHARERYFSLVYNMHYNSGGCRIYG